MRRHTPNSNFNFSLEVFSSFTQALQYDLSLSLSLTHTHTHTHTHPLLRCGLTQAGLEPTQRSSLPLPESWNSYTHTPQCLKNPLSSLEWPPAIFLVSATGVLGLQAQATTL